MRPAGQKKTHGAPEPRQHLERKMQLAHDRGHTCRRALHADLPPATGQGPLGGIDHTSGRVGAWLQGPPSTRPLAQPRIPPGPCPWEPA